MGEPTDDPSTQIFSTRDGAPSTVPAVILTSGLDAGRLYRLTRDRTTTIGRARECDVCLSERGLSRVHAAIELYGDVPSLVDRGSRNGTRVEGVRVEGKRPLRSGDKISLGPSAMLRFTWLSSDEAAALDRLYEAATRDGLTGVYNRKQLDLRVEQAVDDAVAEGTPLSLIVLDIDHFKKVNDERGHSAGDEVLRRVAAALAARLRRDDVIGRYGGEEFVIVAEADLDAAAQLAERLRAELAAEPIDLPGGALRVTVSAGVAALGEAGASAKDVFELADRRLYEAKRAGRDRVVAGPLQPDRRGDLDARGPAGGRVAHGRRHRLERGDDAGGGLDREVRRGRLQADGRLDQRLPVRLEVGPARLHHRDDLGEVRLKARERVGVDRAGRGDGDAALLAVGLRARARLAGRRAVDVPAALGARRRELGLAARRLLAAVGAVGAGAAAGALAVALDRGLARDVAGAAAFPLAGARALARRRRAHGLAVARALAGAVALARAGDRDVRGALALRRALAAALDREEPRIAARRHVAARHLAARVARALGLARRLGARAERARRRLRLDRHAALRLHLGLDLRDREVAPGGGAQVGGRLLDLVLLRAEIDGERLARAGDVDHDGLRRGREISRGDHEGAVLRAARALHLPVDVRQIGADLEVGAAEILLRLLEILGGAAASAARPRHQSQHPHDAQLAK
ncbi:MAG: GGDEF domain-containing protein [Polyangiaceae bacterium]|nr:GGDEF domain-containing protein [Polyangiaceae bacterium]